MHMKYNRKKLRAMIARIEKVLPVLRRFRCDLQGFTSCADDSLWTALFDLEIAGHALRSRLADQVFDRSDVPAWLRAPSSQLRPRPSERAAANTRRNTVSFLSRSSRQRKAGAAKRKTKTGGQP
jgi:hypothetical protein